MSEENNKGPISFDFDQAKVTTQQSLEMEDADASGQKHPNTCLLYTSPSPRDGLLSRMPSSA